MLYLLPNISWPRWPDQEPSTAAEDFPWSAPARPGLQHFPGARRSVPQGKMGKKWGKHGENMGKNGERMGKNGEKLGKMGKNGENDA